MNDLPGKWVPVKKEELDDRYYGDDEADWVECPENEAEGWRREYNDQGFVAFVEKGSYEAVIEFPVGKDQTSRYSRTVAQAWCDERAVAWFREVEKAGRKLLQDELKDSVDLLRQGVFGLMTRLAGYTPLDTMLTQAVKIDHD